MVGGQYRHGANDQQGLVENKNISMKFCINTAHFCLDNFYVKKCHTKALLDILIFHLHEVVYQFQCQKISDLLCMKFTSPKNNQWSVKCQCVWLHLQSRSAVFQISSKQYSAVFMHYFDKNAVQNSALNHVPLF